MASQPVTEDTHDLSVSIVQWPTGSVANDAGVSILASVSNGGTPVDGSGTFTIWVSSGTIIALGDTDWVCSANSCTLAALPVDPIPLVGGTFQVTGQSTTTWVTAQITAPLDQLQSNNSSSVTGMSAG